MRKPQWLDIVIDEALKGRVDVNEIATKIVNHPRFRQAIQRGLNNPPQPGIYGPNHAQIISTEIIEEMQKD